MPSYRHNDYARKMTQTSMTIIRKHELAEQLKVSLSTVERMVKDGRLPKPLRTTKGQNGGWYSTTITAWCQQNQ